MAEVVDNPLDVLGVQPADRQAVFGVPTPTVDPYAALGADPSKAIASPPSSTPAAPQMPTAGPSGNFWTDLQRQLGSAFATAASSATSPLLNRGKWSPQVIPGPTPTTPQEATANAINTMGGTFYQPQTAGGRIGQAALTGGILGLTDPAALPATVLGSALTQGVMEASPNIHPLAATALGFLPGAVAGRTAGNLAIPPAGGGMNAIDATLAQRAQQLGIRLDPAQVSTSPFTKYAYSAGAKMPFSGAASHTEAQLEDFTRATSRTFGEDAPRITPDVLQAAHDRIGDVFNGIAQRTTVPMDNQLMGDLQGIVTRARLQTSAANVEPIERQAMNIVDTAANNSGNIGGRAYLDLTAKGGDLDAMMRNSDLAIRNAGIQLRSVLDDALQRNIAPDEVSALSNARAQWKAMKTVEPLTIRGDQPGGATPSTGLISPAALRSAVNQSYGPQVVLQPTGANTLNDLAKIGQRFLKEPSESGTSPREGVRRVMEVAGGALAGMGAHTGAWRELAALLSAAGANRIAQSAMRTPFMVNRSVAASLNPQGFQFNALGIPTGPAALGTLPFGLSPLSGQPTGSTP